jgi:hypothetical protein
MVSIRSRNRMPRHAVENRFTSVERKRVCRSHWSSVLVCFSDNKLIVCYAFIVQGQAVSNGIVCKC